MKTFKMIRIYKTAAKDQKEAWAIFRQIETDGNLTGLLQTEIVKEEEPTTFFGQVKKQLKG